MSSYLFALKNTKLIANQTTDNAWFLNDRGFIYADGFFDTMRFNGSVVPLWSYHRERIVNSASRLLFFYDQQQRLDFEAVIDQSYTLIGSMLKKRFTVSTHDRLTDDVIIKFIVTRGEKSVLTYVPDQPDLNIYVVAKALEKNQSLSKKLHLKISPLMLDDQSAFAGIKQINRMHYALAAKACSIPDSELNNSEALFVDKRQHLIETARHNIFLELNNEIVTPDLQYVGVAGVFRKKLLDSYKSNNATFNNLTITKRPISLNDLKKADSAFVTNAVEGIIPVSEISIPDQFCDTIISDTHLSNVQYQTISFNKSSVVEKIQQELAFESSNHD